MNELNTFIQLVSVWPDFELECICGDVFYFNPYELVNARIDGDDILIVCPNCNNEEKF